MRGPLIVLTTCAAIACHDDATAPSRAPRPSALQPTLSAMSWIIAEADLPDLGWTGPDCSGFPSGGEAHDLNADGYVVGWSCYPTPSGAGVPHAVRWHPATGSIWDLARAGDEPSVATGINENGVIVGTIGFDPKTGRGGRAFIYDDRIGITPLRTLGGNWSMATKVNISSDVVGVSEASPGDARAFIWRTATHMRALGRLRHANDIDDAGSIAGGAVFEVGRPEHAAISRPDGSVTDFGLRGERAVLTSGPPYVGNFYIDGESRSASRAFIAPLPGAFVRIPTLGGLANAALGSVSGPAVVGWSDATPSIRDAYLWSPEIGALRLHVSPVSGTSSVARAINAKWQIAGSRLVQGFSTAVVWTVTRQP